MGTLPAASQITNTGGTIVNTGDAVQVPYFPAVSGDWTPTVPTQVSQALDILASASGGSGANVTLSNLTSPTAINENLIFATGATAVLETADNATGATQALTVTTGNASVSGNSGALSLTTGPSAAGNTGNIVLATGTASGTQGKIQLQDGTQGTSGYVWTSIDTSGTGSWLAAGGGGANTALSNLASTAVNVGINPATDATLSLGSTGHAWNAIHLNTGIQNDTGTLVVDIGNSNLNDNSATLAVDYNTRRLYANDGSTINANWHTPAVITFGAALRSDTDGTHDIGQNGAAFNNVWAYSINPQATQTTLTGTAGTAVCSQPFAGVSYKKVIVYLNGYTDTGTQTFTYPTAFTQTPYVYGLAGGVSGATATTTSIKFTTTLLSGFVIIEGF
jgi:hypothetical protein